ALSRFSRSWLARASASATRARRASISAAAALSGAPCCSRFTSALLSAISSPYKSKAWRQKFAPSFKSGPGYAPLLWRLASGIQGGAEQLGGHVDHRDHALVGHARRADHAQHAHRPAGGAVGSGHDTAVIEDL